MHPDPALLPQVGAFFTGPGDLRPIFAALDNGLQALGTPSSDVAAWRRLAHGRITVLNVIDAQDHAALAANVPAFVKSVTDSTTAFREVAIGATILGTPRCVL